MDSKNRILNIDFNNISKQELLEKLTRGFLVTPNVDHLVKLQKDKEFYNVYQSADWVICDSKIVGLALRFLRSPIKEVIPGSSFFPAFCEFHKNNENVRIFLLGAAEGVALKARENINKKIGREIVVGAHSPSYGFEKNLKECNEIIDIINSTDATVLLVGVGAPKQEKWIYHNRNKLNKIKLFLPLGATIDFEAGKIKRAPMFFQRFALEWLYRIYCEPKRMFKRYFCDDLSFFVYLFKDFFRMYKNPFA